MSKKQLGFGEVSFKDIDAKAFANLVASEQRFRRMLDLTNDPIIEFDKKGKVIFVTKAIKTMFGYTPEQLIGQNMFDFVHISDRVRVANDFNALIQEEKTFVRTEFRGLHNNGTYVWVETVGQAFVDDSGKAKSIFSSIRDVTEHHQAVSMLKKANFEMSLFKQAVEKSYNHIVITDPDGKIVFANDAVTRMTGFTISEVMGRTPALWGKQMPAAFYAKFWDTIKVKQIPFHGEIINKRKDGSLYRAIATVSPIVDKDKQLLGFIGVEEDISELRPPIV